MSSTHIVHLYMIIVVHVTWMQSLSLSLGKSIQLLIVCEIHLVTTFLSLLYLSYAYVGRRYHVMPFVENQAQMWS